MKKYYYKKNGAIVYAFDNNKKINNEYWDEVWNSNNNWIHTITPNASSLSYPIKLIKKNIKKGGSVLEAGCGRGQYVYKLDKLGYDVHGVDNAKNTVNLLKSNYSNLKITNQNLDNLEFKDCYFDAYYSGGVIEHYWNGYAQVLKEAHRVLKVDGIIILTFPYMSKARKKYSLDLPEIDAKPDNFYQFALNKNKVLDDLKKLGFKIKYTSARNGIKGYMDAHIIKSSIKYKIINSIYKGNNFASKIAKRLFSAYLICFGYGHTTEIIAIKKK